MFSKELTNQLERFYDPKDFVYEVPFDFDYFCKNAGAINITFDNGKASLECQEYYSVFEDIAAYGAKTAVECIINHHIKMVEFPAFKEDDGNEIKIAVGQILIKIPRDEVVRVLSLGVEDGSYSNYEKGESAAQRKVEERIIKDIEVEFDEGAFQ